MELDFNPGKKEKSYKLSIGNLNYQLSSGMSLQVPFQNSFSINVSDPISSMAHTTDFIDGTWKGKYLLLNTTIPDSVMTSLSKKMETVVLWRWNKPSSFAVKTDYDYKYLTPYGNQAILQAQAIRKLDSMIVNTGNQTALVHSIQFQPAPQVFGMGGKGSSNYAKLDGYLRQINEDYIINSGYFENDVAPPNPGDTLKDSALFEFRKAMKIVNGLYSNGKDSTLKHLIILSAGPASISQDLISMEELDSLFDKSFSVDCSQPVWKHISFPIIQNIALQRPLVSFDSIFYLPEFRPSSIMLQVSNTSKNYSFPLSPDQASFSIMAKSDSTWNNELTWIGYDKDGKLFGTAKSKVESYVSDKDTGLVKLWAGNSERLAEKSESGLELKYGVVSEDYCLKIYPTFKGYDSTATAYSISQYYFAPDKKTGVNIRAGVADRLTCSLIAGRLLIKLPGNGIVKRIRIYTIDGKLLADFDPSQFKTPLGYIINQSSIHMKEKYSGIVLIRLDSSIGTFKQKMIMR